MFLARHNRTGAQQKQQQQQQQLGRPQAAYAYKFLVADTRVVMPAMQRMLQLCRHQRDCMQGCCNTAVHHPTSSSSSTSTTTTCFMKLVAGLMTQQCAAAVMLSWPQAAAGCTGEPHQLVVRAAVGAHLWTPHTLPSHHTTAAAAVRHIIITSSRSSSSMRRSELAITKVEQQLRIAEGLLPGQG
jgi:hypothetical protein